MLGKLFLLCAFLSPLALCLAGLSAIAYGPGKLSGTLICLAGLVDLTAYGVAFMRTRDHHATEFRQNARTEKSLVTSS